MSNFSSLAEKQALVTREINSDGIFNQVLAATKVPFSSSITYSSTSAASC